MNTKGIVKKIGVSVAAQLISLAVSFIMNLIVPKFISEFSYAHWQTYLLYVNYVGILHFGLLDGILLRYSQYDYEQLDKPLIRSQYRFLLLINATFSILIAAYALIATKKITSAIIILVAIGVITKNSFTYTSYTFQMTNRIANYAKLIILQRIVYGILAVILILVGSDNFVLFCLADLVGDIIGILYGFSSNKSLFLGGTVCSKKSICEFKANITSGIKLMIATWSSIMLVGASRIIIQVRWDELTFGKVSFAFSLTNLFLTFVTAASVVLFPSLKRMDERDRPELYKTIREIMSPFLFVIMVFYFPGCWVLGRWLPKYSVSLTFLGCLLPMIVFSSKTSLLTDNFLKAYRKEKELLIINIISVVFAILGFCVCAWVFQSLELLLFWVVISIMLKSILSEFAVARIIEYSVCREIIIEIIMAIAFVLIAYFCDLFTGFLLYCLLCIGYIFLHKDIFKYLSTIKNK